MESSNVRSSQQRDASKSQGCLYFDELLTILVEAKAVLNSHPLTYVSSENIEPLTLAHLLSGFHVLTLPDQSATDSDDPDCSPPEKLTHQMRHLSKVFKHFWTQWKRGYLLELHEFHRVCEESGSKYEVQEGDVIIVYDAGQPRGLWRLSKVENIVRGADDVIHGIKLMSKRGALKILRRPLHQIYPLEVCSKLKDKNSATTNTNQDEVHVEKSQPPMSSGKVNSPTTIRPVRRAFSEALD